MNKKQYFASSNSMMGFQSYFNEIYDPAKLKRIYIIKGGPGTGKSSTIKTVGSFFEDNHECEYFLCSSDPNSVDGLIIDREIAIIDGTSPHATEAKYPGAVEIIVDNATGISFDIAERKREILDLSKEKSKYYKYAYTYLRAAGEIKKEHLKKVKNTVDVQKLNAAIGRYFKHSFKPGQRYTEEIRLTEGITPIGTIYTSGFESISKNQTIIVNGKGYEEIIYTAIIKKAQEYKLKVKISYDPLIPYSLNGMCITEQANNEMCVVKYNKKIHGDIDYDKYKVLNFERFIKKAEFDEMKSKVKFAERCIESLTQEAIENLANASQIHKTLEDIYLQYTDFPAIKTNTDKIITEISSLL